MEIKTYEETIAKVRLFYPAGEKEVAKEIILPGAYFNEKDLLHRLICFCNTYSLYVIGVESYKVKITTEINIIRCNDDNKNVTKEQITRKKEQICYLEKLEKDILDRVTVPENIRNQALNNIKDAIIQEKEQLDYLKKQYFTL